MLHISFARIIILICLFSGCISTSCQNNNTKQTSPEAPVIDTLSGKLQTGAEQTALYFPLLNNKKVGIVTNHTGRIGKVHLVDSMVKAGIDVVKIFAPEHGFRGHAEAGEKVQSDTDPATGIKIVSLYGSHFKPAQSELKGIDIMIFDIQDVGARFYTYISTMHYVMEASAEANIPLIILDRPNPNGFYVDGPVLQPQYQSFIGMHPIPVVHGMTTGELALMINGEGWLKDGLLCNVTVIPVNNYTHATLYELPEAPSPNLQTIQSIYLYPSLCLFEGTVMSIGRGTDYPFEVFGHPKYPDKDFSFKPESRPGYAAQPPCMGELCYGINLHEYADILIAKPKLELKWLIYSYNAMHKNISFFQNNMFDKLAGNSELRQQIIAGKTEEEIRQSWQPQLNEFKAKRKQYLLYEDYE